MGHQNPLCLFPEIGSVGLRCACFFRGPILKAKTRHQEKQGHLHYPQIGMEFPAPRNFVEIDGINQDGMVTQYHENRQSPEDINFFIIRFYYCLLTHIHYSGHS